MVVCISYARTLVWRNEQEFDSTMRQMSLAADDKSGIIATVGNNGNLVRVWDKSTGYLKFEHALRVQPKLMPRQWSSNTVAVTASGDTLLIDDAKLLFFDSSGDQKWTGNLDSKTNWMAALAAAGQSTVGVFGFTDQLSISVVRLQRSDGTVARQLKTVAPWFSVETCRLFASQYLVCLHNGLLYSVDLLTNGAELKATTTAVEGVDADNAIISDLQSEHYIGLKLATGELVVYKRDTGGAGLTKAIAVKGAGAAFVYKNRADSPQLAVVKDSKKLKYYDLSTGSEGQGWTADLPNQEEKTTVDKLLVASIGNDREVLLVREDCTVELYVQQRDALSVEWTRHDALASILAVDMVDLPLSETQANIETEFSAGEDSLVAMLLRRLTTQATLIRRAMLQAVDDILTGAGLLGGDGSEPNALSEWLESLRNGQLLQSGGGRSESGNNRRKVKGHDKPFERDYFGLHKMIVAVAENGQVFGIDNRNGAVIWTLWLGDDVQPLSSSEGTQIPLFVQRTTAHFPHPAQCLLAVQDKRSKLGILVSFNPITGAKLDRVVLTGQIKQITQLPYLNSENLHAVLVVDKSGKPFLYPRDVVIPPSSPIYLMFVDDETAEVHGQRFDSQHNRMITVWRSSLPLTNYQKVIKVLPKRFGEHVHSQGRVLGDRSVLYKYLNPNLVAVVAAGTSAGEERNGQITVFLVDSVTGRVVYAGKHAKTSGPLHMVHCENWLAYLLWNEKARRMEMNVLEMYEGYSQSDPDRFSSSAPTVAEPVVMKQAYVFHQGATAMAVTETEKGLTNRNVLIAMPFGGILEVPKMFLDPRRPLEPTMEHREEGLFPYAPDLPVATESVLNYNQTVLRIRGIKTSPSGLESTSLMLAYGLDLYYTRLTPSGTFDILKDDFDHLFISAVLLLLVVASVVSKRLARRRDLQQSWK